MERESNPMEALCRSGCGFYGNPSTDGLCSVCFKEALKKKQQPPATTPSAVSSSFVAAPAPAHAPTPLAAAAPTVPSLPQQQQHADFGGVAEIRGGERGGHERRQHGRFRHRRRRQRPQQGQKEKEQMRRLPQEGRTHRVRMSLRRSVLRRASVQRQARVLVRLPGARRAGDPPQQSRRRVAEDTQDMSLPPPPLPPSSTSRPSQPRPWHGLGIRYLNKR